jgi:hypothetical protein
MSALEQQRIVINNKVQLQTCSLYTHTHPMLEFHHVCPESWWAAAGKTPADIYLLVCPSCHYGIHVAIDGILIGQDISLLPKRWVKQAERAYNIASQNGLIPRRTL